MRIIIAEDDANLINMLSPYLRERGYDFTWVSTGTDLLKKIKEARFDVIISDINIPQMNGVEAFEKTRAMEEYKNTPFILWSGVMMEEGEKLSREHTKVRFMKKPFTIARLERFIAELTKLEIVDNFSDPKNFKLND